MRSVTVNAPSATGASNPVILDQHLTPQNVGVVIKVPGTSATKLQFSLDDPYADYATSYNADALWLDDKNLTSLAANTAGVPICASGFPIPVRALRINNTAWTSGVNSLTVVQVGGIS